MINSSFKHFLDIIKRNAVTTIPRSVLFLLFGISKTWELFTFFALVPVSTHPEGAEQNCTEVNANRLWKHGKKILQRSLAMAHCYVSIRGIDQRSVWDLEEHIMQHGKGVEQQDDCFGRPHWLALLARLNSVQVKPKQYKAYVTLLRAH